MVAQKEHDNGQSCGHKVSKRRGLLRKEEVDITRQDKSNPEAPSPRLCGIMTQLLGDNGPETEDREGREEDSSNPERPSLVRDH